MWRILVFLSRLEGNLGVGFLTNLLSRGWDAGTRVFILDSVSLSLGFCICRFRRSFFDCWVVFELLGTSFFLIYHFRRWFTLGLSTLFGRTLHLRWWDFLCSLNTDRLLRILLFIPLSDDVSYLDFVTFQVAGPGATRQNFLYSFFGYLFSCALALDALLRVS